MTCHLRPEELVDLAEGVRPESGAPHLATCASCRQQLADLRAALSTAFLSEVAVVPEPSPLFWEALSDRVRETVAAEGAPRSAGWLSLNPWRWPVSVPLAGAAAAIIVTVALTRDGVVPGRPDLAGPPSTGLSAGIESAGGGELLPLGAADDPTLVLVADLAEDMDLEAAREAGLTTPAHAHGAIDFIDTLTDAERLELQRLLEEEIAKS